MISLYLSIQKCFYYLLTWFSQAPEKDSLNTWQVREHDNPRVLLVKVVFLTLPYQALTHSSYVCRVCIYTVSSPLHVHRTDPV